MPGVKNMYALHGARDARGAAPSRKRAAGGGGGGGGDDDDAARLIEGQGIADSLSIALVRQGGGEGALSSAGSVRFELTPHRSSGLFTLRSPDQRFLSASETGEILLTDWVCHWELFSLEQRGRAFCLRSSHGKYVHEDVGGRGQMLRTGGTHGAALFTVERPWEMLAFAGLLPSDPLVSPGVSPCPSPAAPALGVHGAVRPPALKAARRESRGGSDTDGDHSLPPLSPPP